MADEVTKKDLQSLQGYCNKKIADVEKGLQAKIDSIEKNLIESLNKAIEVANKNDSGFQDILNKLAPAVNQHEKTISELAATITRQAAAIKAIELG